MNRKTVGRASVLSLMIGTATVACTPHGEVAGPATLSGTPVSGDKIAAAQAAKARDALAHHRPAQAVEEAERAVAASPRAAEYRMLLGQAYLTAGRFNSAETSFRDSLSLNADQPRARFDLALVETAQGRGPDARADLRGLETVVPKADLGLALALAGDDDGGIAMLVAAAREDSSTARLRQNLALAYALDGKWREARAMAMQDTPPDRINQQIEDWAALAGPGQSERQVALMLGVQPAPDGGLPTALALAQPPVQPPAHLLPMDAAVAVALADTTVAAPAPAPAAPVLAHAEPVTAPAAMPVSAPAPAAAVPVPGPMPVPAPPVALAAAAPTVPRLLQATTTSAHLDFVPVQAVARSGYVVQLGAYARTGAIDAAWAQAARVSPQMASLSPVRGEFIRSGATLVRLSVGGFAERGAAERLCDTVKARGGRCFVRATANDAPLQWARADAKKVQLAAS